MLRLEQLEDRCQPSINWPTEIAFGDYDGDNFADKAEVATTGGSAHVQVTSGFDQSILLNTIAFDPNFRGGGHVHFVGSHLLVVPGIGGGPVVAEFFNDESYSFFAPFPIESRNGLKISSFSDDIAMFINNDRLQAIHLSTYTLAFGFYVGPNSSFEPTGGTILNKFIVIQYGEIVDFRVPTKVFDTNGNEYGISGLPI